jgi:hypothetical protein
MLTQIGRLAIASAVGVIVGAGIILGITQIGSESHITRHMIVEQGHLTQEDVRHHEIRFDAQTRECVVYDRADNGDTLTIIVPNAMPTYEQKWGNPKGIIIECETRE